MALTIGSGPLGERPEGSFDVAAPTRPLLYWEPFAKRLRVVAGGEIVADSRAVMALHETGQMMRLCVPRRDVRFDMLREGESEDVGRLGLLRSWSRGGPQPVLRLIDNPPEAAATLAGHLVAELEHAEAWYLEDEPGYAHPRDPYHRFDVHRSSRHVIVKIGGDVIAESNACAMLFETSTPVRFYLPPEAVRRELLVRSAMVSQCPYKGDGQHWHVDIAGSRIENAGWSLTTPMGDALQIPRWFSFYPEKVSVLVDGNRLS